MNLSHIEHLGIAVKSIEASLPYYEGILDLRLTDLEEGRLNLLVCYFFDVVALQTEDAFIIRQ